MMKNTLRRLVGAWALLPLMALAQQPAPGGWWDHSRPAAAPMAATGGDTPEQSAATPLVPAAPAAIPATLTPLDRAALSAFECVEVKQFDVTTGFIGSKEDARAATIPATQLQQIQRAVAGQIPEKARGLRSTLVGEGWPECPDPSRALVMGGRITDYKEGNQALRYWVGFGAGAQKFSVDVWLARKSDGALIAREEVVDRKVGGWIGGQSDKGLDDFAEKVAGFVRDSLAGASASR